MMIHLIHMYLSAYIHRRQQTIEFNTKYIDFLNEDISTSHSYNIIQLVLVSSHLMHTEVCGKW